MTETLGPYRLLRRLGQGGMGAVFAARDSRLDRDVALKVIVGQVDAEARERFLREARAAARVNHPNVCQIYEAGEAGGSPFIAMELLDGEPLDARIARGPMPVAEAFDVLAGMLAALQALHARGVVHRDLKPANVFLTPHGVKVLDFGLARPPEPDTDVTGRQLTRPGMLLGTPRYMAPEQWAGEPAGPACDLFAAGAILHEMVSGRPAFGGATLPEICRSVTATEPPPLSDPAAERVVRRALRKRPEERYPSAEAMSRDARSAPTVIAPAPAAPRHATRLAALPLRVLRPDPETDFLAFSLPDEITTSLSAVRTLTVRSTAAASAAAGDPPDLRAAAAALDVDAVLTGTLLRAGSAVRVSAQLVEVPSGTVLWSKSTQASLKDLFQLQDELAREIVGGLSLKLSPTEDRGIGRDVPSDASGYRAYLQANGLKITPANSTELRQARQLYEECVKADPDFAPAWARLGRICRILAKYAHADVNECRALADRAFRRAFELNPDLPLAHNLYTNFEVEDLGRPRDAMVRLLGRARTGAADPNLYAGLVHACRFLGLLDPALAAHDRARRLDPNRRTGVQYALYLRGDYEAAAAADDDDPPTIRLLSLQRLGRAAEAAALVRDRLTRPIDGLERHFLGGAKALLEARIDEGRAAMEGLLNSGFRDAEGLFLGAAMLGSAGDSDTALRILGVATDRGFSCPSTLEKDPGFTGFRDRPEFRRLVERSREGHEAARKAFVDAGGPSILET